MELKVIARIHNDFPEKFGLPRQSGLVETVKGRIVFEEAYRDANALRGLEDFSHIWLIWGFSMSEWKTDWSPTVRPPRLGGNKRMGVFATRAPYRPNPMGLSSVRIEKIDFHTPEGPVIHVLGADLMDGTPIYDIKPYLPYADSHPDAKGGFGQQVFGDKLHVTVPDELLSCIPADKQAGLLDILRGDPRPHYHEDGREYGVSYAGMNVRFTVQGDALLVVRIMPLEHKGENQ